jgi:hypothetical protein
VPKKKTSKAKDNQDSKGVLTAYRNLRKITDTFRDKLKSAPSPKTLLHAYNYSLELSGQFTQLLSLGQMEWKFGLGAPKSTFSECVDLAIRLGEVLSEEASSKLNHQPERGAWTADGTSVAQLPELIVGTPFYFGTASIVAILLESPRTDDVFRLAPSFYTWERQAQHFPSLARYPDIGLAALLIEGRLPDGWSKFMNTAFGTRSCGQLFMQTYDLYTSIISQARSQDTEGIRALVDRSLALHAKRANDDYECFHCWDGAGVNNPTAVDFRLASIGVNCLPIEKRSSANLPSLSEALA